MITLLTTVHNEEKNLPKFLHSLKEHLPKTMPIVFIDDMSTDNSAKILEHFAKTWPIAKVLKMKKKGNLAIGLNFGLEFVDTPYIFRMDADDWLLKFDYHYICEALRASKPKLFSFKQQYYDSEENDFGIYDQINDKIKSYF